MDATVWWTLLSLASIIALVLIGLRRWPGWALFTLVNVLWVVYSAAYDERWIMIVVNALFVVVSAYFTYSWRKTALDERSTVSVL